jgi:L,D-transpeptidase catalytic domain
MPYHRLLVALLSLCATLAVRAGPALDPVSPVNRAGGLAPQALAEALAAVACAQAQGVGAQARRLAVIDYTRPSREARMWVLDLSQGEFLYAEHVAHGSGSGFDVPDAFSNRAGSHQTSLGLFLTDDTYEGGNGYSLRMHGLSGELNDAALARRIVMHGASYVDPVAAARQGRLGRSWGCPALRPAVARPVIDALKQGQFLYAYGPGSAPAARCSATATATTSVAMRTPPASAPASRRAPVAAPLKAPARN